MLISKRKTATCLLTLLFHFSNSFVPAFAAVTYQYDNNGNQISDTRNCYTYNEANQLKQVKNCSNSQLIAEYIYDYNGQRIAKKEYINGVLSKTVYSPSKEYETVKTATGSAQNTTYYYANNELIAKKNPDNTKTFYHNDHLGSSTLLTNDIGALVENTTYPPFGEVVSGGQNSKYQFTGQEKDSTGLNYYGARYYNSHLAHFTQPDTQLPNIYDPQQLNRYAYSRNNPLKYIDPSGHQLVNIADTGIWLLGVGGVTMSGAGLALGYLTSLMPISSVVAGAAYGAYDCSQNNSCSNIGWNMMLGAQMTTQAALNPISSMAGASLTVGQTGELAQFSSDQLFYLKNLKRLEQVRQRFKLPEADNGKTSTGTVATAINNRTGESGNGLSPIFAKQNEVQNKGVKGVFYVPSDHAEIQSILSIYYGGGLKSGDKVSVFTDRPPCGFCDASGGIRSLVRNLDLGGVRVYSPSGILNIKP